VGVTALSDEELLLLIDEADRHLYSQGLHLSARQMRCIVEVCRKLGHTYSIGTIKDPFVERLRDLGRNFFRPKDGGAPSIFTGLMTHLGFSFQVHVPMIFGRVNIQPFDHTDATEWQLRRIYRVREEFEVCFDQVCDVWDIGTQLAPLDDKERLTGRVAELFDLASFHLTAAVSTVSQRSANRGAAQSALISTELGIKSVHLANGRTEKWIKEHVSHDLSESLNEVQAKFGSDYDLVLDSVKKLPPLVAERYGNVDLEALKMAELVIVAQQVLGAVARSFCGYGYRSKYQTLP
jgi:hypothetical protein